MQVNGTDLCSLAQDLSKKKFAKHSQGLQMKNEILENILDKINVDKPEKKTRYNMCNALWDFVYDRCPDRCLMMM